MILEPHDLIKFFRKPLLSKIILHRIISVVWLTNFLSEIRSLSSHDDETDLQFLSVKPIKGFIPLIIDDRLQFLNKLQWSWRSLSGFLKTITNKLAENL